MEVPSLVGVRVRLQPWSEQDAAWYVHARDDIVLRFTTERTDLTSAEVVSAIKEARSDPSVAAFAIVEDATDVLVGNLAIELKDGFADLSYFLAPSGRGRGFASDAVRTAIDWVRTLGVREMVAVVAVDNCASLSLLARVGFVREGMVKHRKWGHVTRWRLPLALLPPAAPGSADGLEAPGSTPRQTRLHPRPASSDIGGG